MAWAGVEGAHAGSWLRVQVWLPTCGAPQHTLVVYCIPGSVLLFEVTAVNRTDPFLRGLRVLRRGGRGGAVTLSG